MCTEDFYEILIVPFMSVIGNKETRSAIIYGYSKSEARELRFGSSKFAPPRTGLPQPADRLPSCSLSVSPHSGFYSRRFISSAIMSSFIFLHLLFPWATFGGSMDLDEYSVIDAKHAQYFTVYDQPYSCRPTLLNIHASSTGINHQWRP
jgi:hypothetical protein